LSLQDRRGVNALQHPLFLLKLEVLLPVDVGKAPLFRNDDFLATRELVSSTTESLLDDVGIGVLAPDGQEDLTNVNTSDGSVRFAPGTTHTGLQPSRKRQAMAQQTPMRRTYQHQRKTTSC